MNEPFEPFAPRTRRRFGTRGWRRSQRCGRLDDDPGVLMERTHASLDRVLAHERHVISQACDAARPDSAALARRLVEFELSSELDTFHRAAVRYADVLGEEGIAE